jgi:poly(A)-specific ribonuclease
MDIRFSFQASNVDFLRDHKFDFNKMFHEGIHYLNSGQEKLVRAADESLDDKEVEEMLGLTKVFQILERARKPLVGHNMLCDLALIHQSFYQPLPDTYEGFKAQIHQIFPVIIDTKHLCFAVQKRLSQTKLLEFTSLTDLCGALGSQRGTFYALFSPEVSHGEQCHRYSGERVFHEAGFDAYSAGFVFLRVAHLLAMKNVKSTEAQAVQMRRYFKLVEPFTNRVNLIRGPIHYIDLVARDSPLVRSPWLVVSTPDRSQLTLPLLQKELNCVMDVRQLTPYSAVIVVSSRKRAEALMKELDREKLTIRRYRLTDSPLMARIIGLSSLTVAAAAVIGTVAVYWSRTRSL